MGGVTSTLVTRPSAVTQKRTSWRLPCASRGAPGGGEIAHSGVAAKISLAAPPEPEPESAATAAARPPPRPTAAAALEQLRAAPQHEDGDREVRRERKRRGRPLAPPLHRQRVGIKQRPSGIGHWTNTYPITKTGARFPCPGVPERRGIPSALPALPPPQA